MKYIIILPSCWLLNHFFLLVSDEMRLGTFKFVGNETEETPLTAEEIGQEMGGN